MLNSETCEIKKNQKTNKQKKQYPDSKFIDQLPSLFRAIFMSLLISNADLFCFLMWSFSHADDTSKEWCFPTDH